MSKDPAFLFYSSDFLTGTALMSYEETGKYIKLLCYQHQHGGYIPEEPFNMIVPEVSILRTKFIKTDNGYYNERLVDEMGKRSKASNNLSEAMIEVWKKRKQANSRLIASYKQANRKEHKNNSELLAPENENENKNKKRQTKHSFKDSPYYDKNNFKEALSDWPIEKIKSYYEKALYYSEANGGKYLNWVMAVRSWASKDELKAKKATQWKMS